jgi:hypothetical protein
MICAMAPVRSAAKAATISVRSPAVQRRRPAELPEAGIGERLGFARWESRSGMVPRFGWIIDKVLWKSEPSADFHALSKKYTKCVNKSHNLNKVAASFIQS